jgi:hypothetical protein
VDSRLGLLLFSSVCFCFGFFGQRSGGARMLGNTGLSV